MKTILTVILAALSISAFSQMTQDSTEKRTFIESKYYLIDTVVSQSSGDIDTVRYSEAIIKSDLPKFLRDSIPFTPNNDTIYKLSDAYKIDVLHSAKVVVYQRIDKYVMIPIEKKPVLNMIDYLKKRKQLDYNIDAFWNLPQITELTNN